MDPLQFPLKINVEVEKLPPQIPVTALEPGDSLYLATTVLLDMLKISVALGFGININYLPQI